jgi:DNA-binding IscR family transcriptional regulator
VRRAVAKLSKAGLLVATRGRNGRCMLSRAPKKISLLEIYRASEAPPTFSIHTYPIERTCPISSNIKGSMKGVLDHAQDGFEKSLAKQTLADVVAAVKAGEKEALASRGKKKRVAKSA